MLGAFYSLALHMHQSLGGWPVSIGERGFPSLLLIHATITVYYFVTLLLSAIIIIPCGIAVCLAAQHSRRFVPYLALYICFFFVCWGLMQFAPGPFLYWWRD